MKGDHWPPPVPAFRSPWPTQDTKASVILAAPCQPGRQSTVAGCLFYRVFVLPVLGMSTHSDTGRKTGGASIELVLPTASDGQSHLGRPCSRSPVSSFNLSTILHSNHHGTYWFYHVLTLAFSGTSFPPSPGGGVPYN